MRKLIKSIRWFNTSIGKETFSILIVLLVLLPNLDAQKLDSTFFKQIIHLDCYKSDSLEIFADQLLTYEGSDSLYVLACMRMGTFLHRTKKYNKRVAFTTQLLKRKDLVKDLSFYSKSYGSLGGTYFRLKKNALCFTAFSKAVIGLRQLKDSVSLVKLYTNISSVHTALGNSRAALDTLKAIEPMVVNSEKVMEASGYYFLTALKSAYSRLNDFETSVQYSKKALKLTEIHSEQWCDVMCSIALHYSTENVDSAAHYLNQLLAYKGLNEYPREYQKAHLIQMTRMIRKGQFKDAEKLLLHLIDFGKKNNYELEEDYIHQKKALIKKHKKEYSAAMFHFKKSYELYQKNNGTTDFEYINSLVVGYLESKLANDKDTTASKFLDIYFANTEKLRNKIVEEELEDFKVQFNTKEKERENELLQQQKSLLEKNNSLQRWLLLLGGLLVSNPEMCPHIKG